MIYRGFRGLAKSIKRWSKKKKQKKAHMQALCAYYVFIHIKHDTLKFQ